MNASNLKNPLYASQDFSLVGKHPSFSESNVYENKTEEFAITDPLPNSEEIIKFYESGFYIKDESLDGINKRLQVSHERALAQMNFINSFIQEKRDSNTENQTITVLDIGCSEGSLLLMFQERGFKVIGYEPDTKMANFANGRLVKPNKQELIVKNEIFGHQELKENSYDIVCSSHIFEHLPDPILHLQQLKRVLKTEGMLFMELPNQYGLGIRNCITPSIFPPAKMQGHLGFYSVNSIKKILENNGFYVSHITTCGKNINNFFSRKNTPRIPIKTKIITKLKLLKNNVLTGYSNCNKNNFQVDTRTSQDESNIFERYWSGKEQGQWIRLIAKPKY